MRRSTSTHPTGPHRRSGSGRARVGTSRSDQRGVSLVVSLIVMVLIGTLVMGLLAFASTANRSATAHIANQDLRFAGDNSLRAAVNYVANQPELGLDQTYFPAEADDCRLDVPGSATGASDISVSCEAIDGTESGIPAETGKVPDDALLLLGTRYGDLPVYSPCTGTALTAKGWAQTAASYLWTERSRPQSAEVGLRVDSSSLMVAGDNTSSCRFQKGAVKLFNVVGNLSSNGPISVRSGDLNGGITVTEGSVVAGTSPYGSLTTAPVPCSPQIAGCTSAATARNRSNPAGPSASPYDPGEALFTDPALDASRGDEWRQATVNWSAPKVSINGAAPVSLTPTTSLAGCTQSPNIIRFYPGLYTSARALNRIFNYPACAKGADSLSAGIYWFGPAETATVDDSPTSFSLNFLAAGSTAQTGVYAFDFRDTAASYSSQAQRDAELPCGTLKNSNNLHRWCTNASLEGIAPSIIGGWPKDWDAQAVIAPPSPTDPNAGLFEALTAATVDEDGSFTWDNSAGAATFGDAGTLGAAGFARYYPSAGTSINRSIILSGFPGATAVQADGELAFTVRHKESNSRFLDAPKLTLSTTERGVAVPECGGTYTLQKSPDVSPSNINDGWVDHVVSTDSARSDISLTPAQQSQVRQCFRTAERIQNIQLRWEVNGDFTNQGSCQLSWAIWNYIGCVLSPGTKPQVFLDGIKVTAQIPKPHTFGQDAPAGVAYCDDSKPGVQFIFGGDSTLHLGRASFQICAGPPPENTNSYQQIAMWGQPVNYVTSKSGASQTETRVGKVGTTSLKPTSISVAGRTLNDDCAWWDIPCHFRNIVFEQPSWDSGTVQQALTPGDRYTNPAKPLERSVAKFNTGRAWKTFGDADLGGWGKVGVLGGACNATTDICKHSDQVVSSIILKVGYNTDCDAWFGPFCNVGSAGKLNYKITGFSGDSNAACSGSLDAVSNLAWFSTNVTSCFGSESARSGNLSSSSLNVKLTFDCNFCVIGKTKVLEGAEFVVGLSTPESSKIVSPATGCKTGLMGYGSGVGDYSPMTGNYVDENARNAGYLNETWGTDCALISGAPPVLNLASGNPSGNPLDEVYGTARTSVRGTIFAPSDALEVSDGDNFYPFASRGIVARHLRVRALEGRNGYSEPLVTNQIDRTPNSRSVVMVACRKAAGRTVADECDSAQGDLIVAEAGVRFDPPPVGSSAAWTPTVLWWNTNELA